MPHILIAVLTVCGYGVATAATIYAAVALWRVWSLLALPVVGGPTPPITVLKPVRGAEPNLAANLRSFCEQDYPEFQILFGVRERQDPAIPIVEGVVRDFAHRGAALVIDPTVVGNNYKIANVANMMSRARYDILVIADADCVVGPTYLRDIASVFADPGVGAVTCLYKGTPLTSRLPDRLGAMFINEIFLPSVRVALLTEPLRYCFGATMAVRRNVLESIGGMKRLASFLADDYMLGNLVSAQGLKVALAPHIVDVAVNEPGLGDLLRHELRWARTMRTVRPVGYGLSVLTDAIPITMLWALLTGFEGPALGLAGLALCLRLLTHFAARRRLAVNAPATPWLVPVRDLLTFALRLASFTGRRVAWQNHDFTVQPDGQMVLRK